MNLLYLHAHDLGRCLSPYEFPVETPALGGLAERPGTRLFVNAHSAAPTCSPSRAALLTGRSPHEAGMLGLMHRGFRLKHPDQHLAPFLQGHGYETALAGIQHIQPGEALSGYRHRLNPPRSLDEQGQPDWGSWDRAVAEEAARFISGCDGAFFLDCGFWWPHRPFPDGGGSKVDSRLGLPGIEKTPENQEDLADFAEAIRRMDQCCGHVLDALSRRKLWDDTLVIFTTDHGPAFPGYKCRLTDRGTGVAMMIRPPGSGSGEPPGKSEDLVSQLDLFPTICDYLGLPDPPWELRGKSLRPLLDRKGTHESEEAVFGEVTYHAGYEPMRSIRTRRYLLIKVFEDDLRPVPANVDDSACKESWIASGGLETRRESIQLFDLVDDPGETRNRAGDPRLASVRIDLETRLRRWMEETDDPLLRGPVPLPAGAYANARTDLSATIGEPAP